MITNRKEMDDIIEHEETVKTKWECGEIDQAFHKLHFTSLHFHV